MDRYICANDLEITHFNLFFKVKVKRCNCGCLLGINIRPSILSLSPSLLLQQTLEEVKKVD